jgi:hypothetical protein
LHLFFTPAVAESWLEAKYQASTISTQFATAQIRQANTADYHTEQGFQRFNKTFAGLDWESDAIAKRFKTDIAQTQAVKRVRLIGKGD